MSVNSTKHNKNEKWTLVQRDGNARRSRNSSIMLIRQGGKA